VLELVLLWGEKNSSHTHEAASWHLLGVLFQISVEHPRPIHVGTPLGTANTAKLQYMRGKS